MEVALGLPSRGEVSTLLRALSNGDRAALQKLTPLVYGELRRMARQYLKGERDNITLETADLVNEAYLRLVDCNRLSIKDCRHFFAISAQLMRRILVDHARRRNLKRGAGIQHIALKEVTSVDLGRPADLVALDDAMDALARFDARKAQVVELRFFGGLSVEDSAPQRFLRYRDASSLSGSEFQAFQRRRRHLLSSLLQSR